MLDKTGTVLDRFPVIRSTNPEEVEDNLIRVYGARKLSLPRSRDELDVRANHWDSPNIALSYCSYGGAVRVEFPGADFYRLQLPLQGSAAMLLGRSDQRHITKSETTVIPPATPLLNEFPRAYEQLVLRVKEAALWRKLGAFTDKTNNRKLEFASVSNGHGLESLQRLILFFIDELDSHGSGMPPLAQAELEQAIVVSFLCSTPSNLTAILTETRHAPANWQVRRAEEYIEANWNEPLSVESIARVCGASTRSIFHHFKRSRGQSPMAFVRQLRLQHARKMLTRTDADVSVTEAAFACGFSNLGHFARHYFKLFRERPSDTVKRRKV